MRSVSVAFRGGLMDGDVKIVGFKCRLFVHGGRTQMHPAGFGMTSCGRLMGVPCALPGLGRTPSCPFDGVRCRRQTLGEF